MGDVSASPAPRVWVVVGASRGIGLEHVTQVLATGGHVVAAARKPQTAPALQRLKECHGPALHLVPLDIDDRASIKSAVEAVTRVHPAGIDYLVMTAGILDVGHAPTAIATSAEALDRVLRTNLVSAFATIQAFYPLLKAKEGGKKTVVTLSSSMAQLERLAVDARLPAKPLGPFDTAQFAYKVSKTALNQVTVQLANELKGEGFTFVAIHPGTVDTDMLDDVTAGSPELRRAFKARAITAERTVANQLAFLATATQETANGRFVDNAGNRMDW